MEFLKKYVFMIVKRVNYLANIAIVLMTVLICANVIMRSAFRQPIEGTEEIVAMLAGIVIACSIGHTAAQKAHIAIEILKFKYSKKLRKMVKITVVSFSLFTYTMACYYIGISATHQLKSGEMTQGLQIPLYPVTYCISFGCGILCLVLFIDLLASIRKKRDIREVE
jgi:TRAP-type C4-dicarboxylate transport system permease small subunit